MADGTIDRLEIEVSGSAEQAAASMERLAQRLDRMGSSLAGVAPKVTSFAQAIQGMRSGLAGLDVSKLQQLSTIKISSTVPNNVGRLAQALATMPAGSAASLQGLGSALTALSGFKLSAASVTQLQRLPEVLREWQGLDMASLAQQMAQLNAQLSSLATNVTRFSAGYRQLPSSMRGAARAARSVSQANQQLAASTEAASSRMRMMQYLLTSGGLILAFQRIGRVFTESTQEVSDYIESMNLFAASMGQFTDEATGFAQRVQEAMGIDAGEWSRFQGVLMSIGTGFGIAGDRAAVMSQNMAQLGYDISSFYNLDIDEAMRKVQSGFAGELEPMRRIGYDLSVARMQIEATNLGIEKQVSDMTQAEKAALRYYLMMNQLTQVHGDMARTLNSPANQLRVFSAQVRMAVRSVGNLLIPILNAVLPYFIALAKAVRLAAVEIARFFGIDASFEVDYSGLETPSFSAGDEAADALGGIGDAAEDADERVKELKRTIMGFDEINKLSDATSGSDGKSGKGSDAGDLGSIIDQIPLDTYDFMKGIDDSITRLSDEIARKLRELLPIIAAIAAGLLGFRLGSLLFDDLGQAIGLGMALAGVVLLVAGAMDAWLNGIDPTNLLEMLGGALLFAVGLGMMFGPVGTAIGAILGGLALLVVGIHDVYVNGVNALNGIAIAAGIAGVVFGVKFFNPTIAAIIAVVGGLAMIVMGIRDVVENGFSMDNLVWIVGGLALAAVGLGIAFGPVAAGIALVIGGIGLLIGAFASLFDGGATKGEIQALGLSFALIGAGIALVTGSWIPLLIGIVAAAIAWVASNWDELYKKLPEPVRAFIDWMARTLGPVVDWLGKNVFEPVGNFIGGLFGETDKMSRATKGGVEDTWAGTPGFFDSSVASPSVASFQSMFDQMGASSDMTYEDLMGKWGGAAGFFDGDVTTPTGQSFEEMFSSMGLDSADAESLMRETWGDMGGWYESDVTTPISSQFAKSFKAIGADSSDVEKGIRRDWQDSAGWTARQVTQPMQSSFADMWANIRRGAHDTWNAIQQSSSQASASIVNTMNGAWSSLMAMFNRGGMIFEGITSAIGYTVRQSVNYLLQGLNQAIADPFNSINSIFTAMRSWNVFGQYLFSWLPYIPVPQIPYLARGGQVESGQLFVARENGRPEMVGTMGGKTTVANNEQIVAGISAGVADAMMRVMMARTPERSEGGDIVLKVGAEELARAVRRGESMLARRGDLQMA